MLIAGAEQGVWNCGAVGCVPPLDSSAVKVESESTWPGHVQMRVGAGVASKASERRTGRGSGKSEGALLWMS